MADHKAKASPDREWLTARDAYKLVGERNGRTAAATSIAERAYVGLIRTRAAYFSAEVETGPATKKRVEQTDVELPKEFWWAKGQAMLKQDWRTGDFSTWIRRRYEWKAFGVEFEREAIEAMLAPPAAFERTSETPRNAAPSADIDAPMPPDEEILAKMLELKSIGLGRDKAAKAIREYPGFESVGNEHARRVASGYLGRGRPKNRQ